MKQIKKANDAYLSILGKVKPSDGKYRLMKYCVQVPVDDGTLLFNVATREMVLLSTAEQADLLNSEYLRNHWFVVPEETNEKQAVNTLRWVVENMQNKTGNITGYTILTTTDCNARCFYCYELGRSRIPMSEETAHKTAAYIRDHCGGSKVDITWFGGEPLYNLQAIDTICADLRQFGVEFTSRMVSNAYLFDDDIVKKAAEQWNLKIIQISLDGTEEVYNKSKAYIHKEGSAYQVVLQNIGRLLNASIRVAIRLNFDLYNAEDLLKLVDELAERFQHKSGLYIYAHHLFEEKKSMNEIHTDEEWQARYDALHVLEQRIAEKNLAYPARIKHKLKPYRCMADNDSCIMILPTGDIGVCEHHTEDEFIGHLDKDGFDKDVIASWKVRSPELAACTDCACYPNCVLLKKCTTSRDCFPQFQANSLQALQTSMLGEYKHWLTGDKTEDIKDDE